MFEEIINPKDYDTFYLEHLNECFPGWGDNLTYKWAFHSGEKTYKSDIITLANKNKQIVAGSAITYRNIQIESEEIIKIGIMTGSWTLPKARGKGCFSQIINLSKQIAKERHAEYLTAFVTETNTSAYPLIKAGSTLIPSNYLFLDPKQRKNTSNINIANIQISTSTARKIYNQYLLQSQNSICFFYSFDEYINQYLERPGKLLAHQTKGIYSLLEENTSIIKLQYLPKKTLGSSVKNIIDWNSNNANKKLFYFCTDSISKKTLLALDFKLLKGFFTLLDTQNRHIEDNHPIKNILINMSDKM